MVSLLDSSRRRSRIAGKADEVRDFCNDNATRIAETVRAWDAGKPRGLSDGCACDVEGQVVDQCSAVKNVEDPADELREMAESRAKAWLAENSAADSWMAELKEFDESREKNSSGAESMLTCSEVDLLTEERTHAGIVSPSQILRTSLTRYALAWSRSSRK